jgi:Domain of unknown function (DUF1992)
MPGRALDLRVNPFVPPDDRLAYDMLAAQGFALPWIEERRDLLRDRDALIAALSSAWERLGGGLPTATARAAARPRWNGALTRLRRDAEALNARIRSHNLTVPVPGMRVALLDVEQILGDLSITR